jgi:hypothetical protein
VEEKRSEQLVMESTLMDFRSPLCSLTLSEFQGGVLRHQSDFLSTPRWFFPGK